MDKSLLTDVVAQMPQKFDAHQLINCFIKMHFGDYVAMLWNHLDTDAVLRSVHAEIMLCMAKYAADLDVQKIGDDSPSQWKKGNVNSVPVDGGNQ